MDEPSLVNALSGAGSFSEFACSPSVALELAEELLCSLQAHQVHNWVM
jgi:hypothetical protein